MYETTQDLKRQIQWLLSELEIWVREGVIEDAQSVAIRGRYPVPELARNWGREVFASFGAVLIGLGVILLFAYNWDRMHKYAKLGVVFSALIAAHGAALLVKRPAIREILHVLGTLFFGAGIWLIAQIYHFDGHYPTAVLVWGLGALSLAWFLPSLPQALMAALLLLLWNGLEVFGFHSPNHAAPFLFLFGVLPLVWVLKSRVLLSVGAATFLFTLLFSLQHAHANYVVPVFLSIAAALIAAGLILKRNRLDPDFAPLCFIIGNSLSILLISILSFRDAQQTLLLVSRELLPDTWFIFFLVMAAGLWIAAFWPFPDIHEKRANGFRWDYLAAPVALTLTALQVFGILKLQEYYATAPYNIVLLLSAIMLMLRGFRTLHLRFAVMGGILFSALAIARSIDLFHSLLARAVVFLIVGGLMLGIGIYFARSRQDRKEEAPCGENF